MSQTVKQEKKEITVSMIEKTVCEYFHVPIELVRSRSRKADVAQARQMIMYFAKRYTDQSLSAIGELLGGRSHATVLHSCKVVEDLSLIHISLPPHRLQCKQGDGYGRL